MDEYDYDESLVPQPIPTGPVQIAHLAKVIREFHMWLKSRDRIVVGASSEISTRTILAMRDVLSQVRWQTASELMQTIKMAGKLLKTGLPSESLVDNMVRRLLFLVREVYTECVNEIRKTTGIDAGPSLHAMLLAREEQFDFETPFKDLKGLIMQTINELLEELEESKHQIANQALDHIHANEVILTAGHSNTVEAFLKKAGLKRTFHVIVAESAPSFQGQKMAMRLAAAGIETTLITDSAVFALMSRVNKVILGTHLVMADGGLMALSGAHALALAAKHHSVPVLVCAAMFKLCPVYPCSYDQDDFNHIANPSDIVDYAKAKIVGRAAVISPLFDYVPPDMVSLFISNIGCNAPSYIYRLLSEYYHSSEITDG